MVAEAKDQTVGTSQEGSYEKGRNCYAPKVRKPYTITKQREKWTEEEHQKFVEALKLYGRAWRQIEEHVGSKTAIQIRSHAQKFFAKISRDSSTDAKGSSSPVPIPPPRPKKKPLHPYPRKTLDNLTDDVFMAKRDNPPTSVYSPTASDALSANLITNTSSKEERGFWLSMKISASVPDSKSTRFELFPQETESTSDSQYNISALYPSIKLFGKTVVVRDTCLEAMETSESLVGCGVNEKSESNSDKVVKELDSEVGFGFVSEHPVAYHMDNFFALPWYSWYEEGSYSGEHMWNLGKESSRGSVPYKRCLAERDGKSLQGQEGQTAPVCS